VTNAPSRHDKATIRGGSKQQNRSIYTADATPACSINKIYSTQEPKDSHPTIVEAVERPLLPISIATHLHNPDQFRSVSITMFNYQNFDEVFGFDPDCSYDEIAVQGIQSNRKALEGLFFEKVLKLLGIKKRESS
jgi:hypothetical protein